MKYNSQVDLRSKSVDEYFGGRIAHGSRVMGYEELSSFVDLGWRLGGNYYARALLFIPRRNRCSSA